MEVMQEKFKKYEAYIESGVDWIGEVPTKWKVMPGLSFLFESNEKNKGMKRNTVLSLSYGKIRVKAKEELTGLVPESFETYQFVNKGDIIFRPTDLQNDKVSLRSAISEYEGIITSAYLNIRVKSIADSKFYHYFFRSIDNNKVIYGLGSGLRQNIGFGDFRRFDFPFPPLQEQTAIANFLDEKTAKIDQTIAQKEKLIELLKERKQIIIQNAVTKGLNPNAKMKPSGIDWIGDIPEHWTLNKIKNIGKLYPGLSGKSGDNFSKENKRNFKPFIPFTSIFRNKIIDSASHQFVYVSKFENQNIVKKNDILFLMSSETIEDIGKSSIYTDETKELYLNSFCKGFRCKEDKVFPQFINDFLQSNSCRNYFAKKGRGFTRINIKQEYILDMNVIIPSMEEQRGIVKFIKSKSYEIETTIETLNKQISKLKEYKKVIIDSAVTGKIKVTDYAN